MTVKEIKILKILFFQLRKKFFGTIGSPLISTALISKGFPAEGILKKIFWYHSDFANPLISTKKILKKGLRGDFEKNFLVIE